jgi:UDPglucose 6-dehydrogenase
VNVCVAGLWHLGTVTAACLARAGHEVIGYDTDAQAIDALAGGRPPIFEPGLVELLREGLANRRLRFTADPAEALRSADALLIAWDTPVDEDDQADVQTVLARAEALFPHLQPGSLVVLSSQLPVGTTAYFEERCAALRPSAEIAFACSPENLRLGKAIEVFTKPDRIVIGVRGTQHRERLEALFAPFGERIEWMSVESAEMTKHALNAFLATSVAFINEVASICERVGADAAEVARGLKTDLRIGPGAYLSPGPAFAGGTLARDVVFLSRRSAELELPLHLIPSVRASNEAHRLWALRRLETTLGTVNGKTVAVWGLTYKPGTDTLRRSGSVELCRALAERGALVRVFDPAIRQLPNSVAATATLAPSPLEAARGAEGLVVATEWPVFREVPAGDVVAAGSPIVFDAGRFLAATLGADERLRYVTVGRPSR